MIETKQNWNTNTKPLLVGLILSLILTLAAFLIADESLLKGNYFNSVIFGLGATQALIQLVLFLHMGLEQKPRLRLVMFLFMLLIIFVIVGGSLWIMANLNYNLMGKST